MGLLYLTLVDIGHQNGTLGVTDLYVALRAYQTELAECCLFATEVVEEYETRFSQIHFAESLNRFRDKNKTSESCACISQHVFPSFICNRNTVAEFN
jgi:hypothetical protein